MSPNAANSLIGDLVAMAHAVEQLPQVQNDLDEAKRKVEELSQTVQARELAIINYKRDIDELNAKVRSLEVERDDASFRVLESEDLANKALSFAKQAESAAAAVMSLLDPPKPQPEPEAQPVPEVVHSLEADPHSHPAFYGQAVEAQPQGQTVKFDSPEASKELGKYFEGQGEGNPTGEQQVGSPATTSQETSNDKPSGHYASILYHDHPGYVSRADWLAGGGTDDSYDWRPTYSGVGSSA